MREYLKVDYLTKFDDASLIRQSLKSGNLLLIQLNLYYFKFILLKSASFIAWCDTGVTIWVFVLKTNHQKTSHFACVHIN